MSAHIPHDASRDNAIQTAAAEWLCEREEGFGPDRARAFAAWCAADPRHAAAVARTARAMELLAEMPAVRAPLQARLQAASQPAAVIVRHSFFRVGAWASTLAAALALGSVLWWLAPVRPGDEQHFVTAASASRQVALNDGSVMTMNANSDVRVRLTVAERRVTLSTGEAHFDVAPDAVRPFVVAAPGVSVRAVGTIFSVRVGAAGVEVLVVEGRVEVAPDDAPAAATPPGERPLLGAGKRAWVPRTGPTPAPKIEIMDTDRLREALAWRGRVTSFSEVPLRDMVAQFNRHNAIQLEVPDPELGARKMGGTFALDQVEAFVRLLAQDGDIMAEWRSEKEIVLRRAR